MTDRRDPSDFQPADADGSFDPGDHDEVRLCVTTRYAWAGAPPLLRVEQVGDAPAVDWTTRDVRALSVGLTVWSVAVEPLRKLRSLVLGADRRPCEVLWARGAPPSR